jgi:hypothetical protein
LSKKQDYSGLFVVVGGGMLIMTAFGWFANVFRVSDIVGIVVAVYVALRITNSMERASNNSARKR